MDKERLKKILAGLSIGALLSGAGAATVFGSSGCGGATNATGSDITSGQSGCGGGETGVVNTTGKDKKTDTGSGIINGSAPDTEK